MRDPPFIRMNRVRYHSVGSQAPVVDASLYDVKTFWSRQGDGVNAGGLKLVSRRLRYNGASKFGATLDVCQLRAGMSA